MWRYFEGTGAGCELDTGWKKNSFPALEEVNGLERLIDTMTPLGYDQQA